MYKHILVTLASLMPLQVIATECLAAVELSHKIIANQNESRSTVAKSATSEANIRRTHRPSAEEVLAGYERSLAVMREKVSFIAELEKTFNGAFEYSARTRTEKRAVYRNRTSFAISVETKGFDEQNKMIYHNCLKHINSPEKAMNYQSRYGQPPEFLRIDFQPERFIERFLANISQGRLLDGVTYGAHNKTFVEVMREARSLRLRDEIEIVNGHRTYVLVVDTKYGKHVLWIDPEFGFNARRMAIHKVTGDYDSSTKLGDPPRPLPPNVNPAVPWCATVKRDLTVDDIKIEKIGQFYVPTSAKIRDYEEYENGQFTELISIYRRKDIKFDPDFNATMEDFLAAVPDETKVYVRYEQGASAVYRWYKGKVVDYQGREVDYRPKKPQSLLAKPLPSLKKFGVELSKVQDSNSIILICFFDMSQRPSRRYLRELAERANELKQQNVMILGVQASKVDKSALDAWVKKQQINLPVGMIEDNEEEARLAWGVRSLPWLILADRKHVVVAEGFGLPELTILLKKLSDPNGLSRATAHKHTQQTTGTLEIGVVDENTDSPLQDARVTLRDGETGEYIEILTDETGIGRIQLKEGQHVITNVSKEGYVPHKRDLLMRIAQGKVERIDIQLALAPEISVSVRDQDGEPVPGAVLQVVPLGPQDIATNSHGKLTFRSYFRPIQLFIVARHAGLNLAGLVPFHNKLGEPLYSDGNVVEIELKPGLTLSGHVTDPQGKGIAGAKVAAKILTGRGPAAIAKAETSVKGQYEITAIPASQKRCWVDASAEGYGTRSVEIATEGIAGALVQTEAIVLDVADLTVSGTVVDANGTITAGATINCWGPSQPERQVTSGTDGTFRIERVCRGELRLSASKGRLSATVTTQGGAENVQVMLSGMPVFSFGVPRYKKQPKHSLTGNNLSRMKGVDVDRAIERAKTKRVLVCFFDLNQRPSRNCIEELAEKSRELNEKNVTVIAVQASEVEKTALDEWVKKYDVPFPVGSIGADIEKTRFTWGVRLLPWLILTDTDHVVHAEGFSLNELEDKIKELDKNVDIKQ